MEDQEEITRPRRRGEPRPPEPQPAAAEDEAAEHEPEPAEVQAQAEQPQPQAQAQAAAQPPQPQPVQAAQPQPQPVAEITRQCSFCFTQQPLSQLDDLGPLMRQCRDTAACDQRAAASGMYPLSETELEAGLSAWQNRQGALR